MSVTVQQKAPRLGIRVIIYIFPSDPLFLNSKGRSQRKTSQELQNCPNQSLGRKVRFIGQVGRSCQVSRLGIFPS